MMGYKVGDIAYSTEWGANDQEIEDDFKNALRCKLINTDQYYNAMKAIYR